VDGGVPAEEENYLFFSPLVSGDSDVANMPWNLLSDRKRKKKIVNH